MRIGIGLPAAIPGAPPSAVAEWAAAAEASGFESVGVMRYVCLGDDAEDVAHHYLDRYYGPAYLAAVSADTATTIEHLEDELRRLDDAGCDDVVLLPCDADIGQVRLLAAALDELRVRA